MSSAAASKESIRPLIALIAGILRPIWPYWLWGTVCTLGLSFCMVGIATMQKSILDLMISGQLEMLYKVLVAWGAGLAGAATVGCVGWFLINYGTALATRSFRRQLVEHVNHLPMSVLEECHSGEWVSRIHSDTAQAVGSFAGSIAGFVTALLSAVMAFIYLSRIHFWLTLAVTCTGPLLFLLGRLFDARLRRLGQEIQASEASIRSFLQEDLQNMEVVRSYGLHGWAAERFQRLRRENRDLCLKQALTRNGMEAVNSSAALLFSISTGVVIALEVIKGNLSTGTLLAFIILLNRLTMPFVQASNTWGGMQMAFSAAGRVHEILTMPLEPGSNSPLLPLGVPGSVPALELRGVTFAHNGRDAVIRGLNLQISPGEVVGLVGGSGAGKTTVARLALGLLQPQAGEVKVCGYSTSTRLAEARALCGYVPQMPYLFNDSVLANVLCGRPGALTGEEEQSLHLDRLAAPLSEGLATQVGERGAQISGGQRQRVALARALLRRPQLLVLDEATSALDNETEAEMQQLLSHCRGQAAVLVIAHRLTTVAGADRIVVLDDGCIAEEGTHAGLLARGGIYSRLWWEALAAEELRPKGGVSIGLPPHR